MFVRQLVFGASTVHHIWQEMSAIHFTWDMVIDLLEMFLMVPDDLETSWAVLHLFHMVSDYQYRVNFLSCDALLSDGFLMTKRANFSKVLNILGPK